VRDGDAELAQDFLTLMAEAGADFTLVFRALGDDDALRALFADPAPLDAWLDRWRLRLESDPQSPEERRATMRGANPAFIPRNHQMEAAILAAVEREDFRPFEELLDVLARPFEDQPGRERFMVPPKAEERVLATFCGT
jgi:serine/tyrosine/threonine adenylyltransferase